MSDITLQSEDAYWPRLAALSLAMLLPSLGTSIANVALPTLAVSFGATMAHVQWVVISYLLVVTSCIVGMGRLGDIIGRSRLLLTGMALFAAASAASAVSPSLWILVTARAVQGLGAAVMMALTVAMVGDMVPKARVGSVMGLLGTVSAVGTALGPSLGGVLIAAFGWPSVFAVLAVLGVIAFFIGRALFPADDRVLRPAKGFDMPGMLLLALSLVAVSVALTMGAELSGPARAALGLVSGLGFAAFVLQQRRAASPLVRLELLREPGLSRGLISLALVTAIVMATLIVGPFYLSTALGLGSVATGIVMTVGPAVAALTGLPAGGLVDRLGPFRVIAAGLVAVMAGSVLMTVLPSRFDVAGYVASLVVITFGYALFLAANTTAVMQGATSDRRGVTSALLGLSRNLGLIIGASSMGAVFALGSRGGLVGPGTGEAGLQLTFAVAAVLAAVALGVSLVGRGRT